MTGLRTHRCVLPTAFLSIILCASAHSQNPALPNSPGCATSKGLTTCNWQAFHHRLNFSHVIAVEHGITDRFTGEQLAHLAGRLGKTVASSGQPGDLTFVILPASQNGINIGPADQPILEFRIYSGPTSRGELLWVEILRGDLDRPWPSSVHSVIDQFEDRLARPQ